jgi:hypothetical protein
MPPTEDDDAASTDTYADVVADIISMDFDEMRAIEEDLGKSAYALIDRAWPQCYAFGDPGMRLLIDQIEKVKCQVDSLGDQAKSTMENLRTAIDLCEETEARNRNLAMRFNDLTLAPYSFADPPPLYTHGYLSVVD